MQRTPTIIVGRQHDELVAWYIEKEEPEAFKQVELKDESLVLTFRPKEYPDLMVTLEGRLDADNACSGTGTYTASDGERGSWEFTGKRVELSEFDEVTTWNIRFDSPDGKRHQALVTVLAKQDKLYAWYSSDDYEIPAQEFRQDGDNVVMSLTTKTEEGSPLDVTFRGRVDGDNVKGDLEYKMDGESGTLEFSGERKS